MRFSTKLTLLFSGIMLALGLTGSYFVYVSNVKILRKDIEKKLKFSAYTVIDKLDRTLFERYGDIRLLAADPILKSRRSTPAEITGRLKAFRDFHRVYASLSFFDLYRVRVADTSGVKIGIKHPLTEFWKDIEDGAEFAVNVSFSESIKENAFHFANVVRDLRGEPLGVVVSRVPVNTIFELMEAPPEAGVGGGGGWGGDIEIDLVDGEGRILYSSYNKAGIFWDILYDWESIKSALDSGLSMGTMEKEQGEAAQAEITAFAREPGYLDFKGSGWTLVLDVPTETAFAPAVELRNEILTLFSAFGAISIIIVYLFSRRISAPIMDLSAAAAEVGKGNLDVSVRHCSGDEIGHLSSAFNRMVGNVKEYRDRLVHYSLELEKGREALVEAQKIARMGNWEWELKDGMVFWSDGIYSILGIHPQGFTATIDALLNRLHPGDRAPLKAALDEAAVSGSPVNASCRVALTDGGVRFARIEARVELEGTRPARMRGIMQDITEGKMAEEELKKLNAELKDALDNVEVLSGLLPICAECKKIRDDRGYWNQIEEYVGKRSKAEFTHSICPECARGLYPDHYRGS